MIFVRRVSGYKKAFRIRIEDAKGWTNVCDLSMLIDSREAQLNRLEAEIRALFEDIPMLAGRMNARQQVDADCMDHQTEALATSDWIAFLLTGGVRTIKPDASPYVHI